MNSASASSLPNHWAIHDPGPKPEPGPARNVWLDARLICRHKNQIEALLDDIAPELRRNTPKVLDQNHVSICILKFLSGITKKTSRAVTVRAILQFLHNGFRSYCRHYKLKMPRIPFIANLGLEDGLLDGNSLEDFTIHRQLTTRWIDRYKELFAPGCEISSQEICGLITTSAALFGGLHGDEFWKQLIKSLEVPLKHGREWFWFDFAVPGRSYQWLADPVTEVLLRRLMAEGKLPLRNRPSSTSVRNAIACYFQFSGRRDNSESEVSLLERAIRGLLIRHYAPDVSAIALGALPNTPLPESAWRRTITGQQCTAGGVIDIPVRIQSLTQRVRDPNDVYVRRVIDQIKTAVAWSSQEERRDGLKEMVDDNEVRDRYIGSASQEILRIRGEILHHYEGKGLDGKKCIPYAFCRFAEDLMSSGGPKRERLAPSTISSYVGDIVDCLPGDFLKDVDVLTVEDRQAAYNHALDVIAKGSLSGLGVAVQLFEKTLLTHFGVDDEVDWSAISLPIQRQTKVDANIVDPKTFSVLMSCLEMAECDDESFRLMWQALAIILYRFGLRRGEAHELTLADLRILNGNKIAVRVSISQLTTNKSRQAFREIGPAILPAKEWRLLSEFRDARAEEGAGRSDPRGVYLFARPGHGSQLFSEKTLFEPITELLHVITSDGSLRIHHFRHGFVSRLFISGRSHISELDELKNRPSDWQRSFRDDAGWLRAFEIGHVSPAGLIESYAHTDSIAHHFYACQALPRILPTDVLSELIGNSGRSLERNLLRYQDDLPSLPPAVRLMLRTARRKWPVAESTGSCALARPPHLKVRLKIGVRESLTRSINVAQFKFSDAFDVMCDQLVRNLDVSRWEIKGIQASVVRQWAVMTNLLVHHGFLKADMKRRPSLSSDELELGARILKHALPQDDGELLDMLCVCLTGMRHRGVDVRLDHAHGNRLEQWIRQVDARKLSITLTSRSTSIVSARLILVSDGTATASLRLILMAAAVMVLKEEDFKRMVAPYLR